MPPETSANRETQEQSIKARQHEVFEKEAKVEEKPTLKPFKEYLRSTPAAPLAPPVKIALWVAGVLVVLLFLAALVIPRSLPRRRLSETRGQIAPGAQTSPPQFATLAYRPAAPILP